jgi:hypothetical protein
MSHASLSPLSSPRSRQLSLALLLALASTSAWAQSVPQTTQLSNGLNTGGTSFMDGFTRLDPGWAVVQYVRFSELNAVKDANGDNVPAFRDPEISSTLFMTQIAYVTPYKLFGGSLGINALIPLTNLDASFAADSPASMSDNGFGVADITFGPYLQMQPVMRDGRPFFIHRFELNAVAPVGKFDRNRDLNQSSGYWSMISHWSFTVLPTPEWEVSARLNYVYNFSADKTSEASLADDFVFRDGKAGDAFWVNFTSSYAVAPTLRLGVNGYYLKQLRDNRTNGVRVADTQQSQFYLGPGGSWQIDSSNILNVNLYLPVEVKNASSGPNLNLMFTHVF